MPNTAFLLLSYGSPEQESDVIPFLKNILGENIPPQRLEIAADKYRRFAAQTGNYSPLNTECKTLLNGIRQELLRITSCEIPCYWGNLFWHPLLNDTVKQMKQDGIQKAVCFATSAFDSTSGNKRYSDALETACRNAGVETCFITKLPLPFNEKLFIESQTDVLLEALAWATLDDLSQDYSDKIKIIFTAHSIPLSDERRHIYSEQLRTTCENVIGVLNHSSEQQVWSWELAFQSASGRKELWLAPDINERIRSLAEEQKYKAVVISPLGFFCENIETQYDLDIETRKVCEDNGIKYFRAKAVGTSPKIFRMIAELCAF
ncbi:MAG: ferrochelatase [Planctomycetaceae bacterium]|nr:ferrochelatase [Planctomycetaceae bacterium]